jgi:hypothetical protein
MGECGCVCVYLLLGYSVCGLICICMCMRICVSSLLYSVCEWVSGYVYACMGMCTYVYTHC